MNEKELLLLLIDSPLTFKQIRSLVHIPGSSLIFYLWHLAKKGYINKTGTRRRFVYNLTEDGLKEAYRYKLLKRTNEAFEYKVREVIKNV